MSLGITRFSIGVQVCKLQVPAILLLAVLPTSMPPHAAGSMADSDFDLCIPLMAWQAFQEDLLQSCGRSHGLPDVRAAIAAVHEAAPPSWSLDLISGLPHLTTAQWLDALQQAVAAHPSHISVYDLQVGACLPWRNNPSLISVGKCHSVWGRMGSTTQPLMRHAGGGRDTLCQVVHPGRRAPARRRLRL